MKMNSNPNSGLAAQFLQTMAETPEDATYFVLEALAHLFKRASGREGVFNAKTTVKVTRHGDLSPRRVKLLTTVATTSLAAEIIAATNDRLSVQPRFVVSGMLLQARIIVFLNGRIVGQLYSSRDGKKLKLDVEELSNARDLGNGVVALEKIGFSVHTPLGSVWAN